MMRACFYAVSRGRTVGVFNTWAQCQQSVNGFSGALFKKFPTLVQAEEFVRTGGNPGGGVKSNPIRKKETTVAVVAKQQQQVVQHQNGCSSSSFSSSTVTYQSVSADGVVVYTDGACSRNGFKGAKAGFGVFWGDSHPDNVSAPVQGAPTNNRAEYMAVISAMEKAIQRQIHSLVVRTDSGLLINSLTKWIRKWRRNGWKKKDGEAVLNQDLLVRMDALMGQIKVKFEKVRGHSGDYGNEQADLLARMGAKLFVPGRK